MDQHVERMNWADWGVFLLTLPKLVSLQVYKRIATLQIDLARRSYLIDTRRKFERKVLADIHALPGGDE